MAEKWPVSIYTASKVAGWSKGQSVLIISKDLVDFFSL